jgi:hypothetical protein
MVRLRRLSALGRITILSAHQGRPRVRAHFLWTQAERVYSQGSGWERHDEGVVRWLWIVSVPRRLHAGADPCSGLYIKPGGTQGIQWVKAGLFDPGLLPKPTSEVFLKDMELWEKPFEGIKHFEANM